MKPTYFNAPSIESFASIGVEKEKAKLCRKIIKGEILITGNPLFPLTNEWSKACHTRPPRRELILEALNETMNGNGIDAVLVESPVANLLYYVSTDDIYDETLTFTEASCTFSIKSIGCYLEKHYNKERV